MKQTLCGMVLLVSVCSSASAATFTPLGDLTGGGFNSSANGVSADGSVVVGVSDSAFGTEAFRWTGGVMTGLGFLAGGVPQSFANGVSANGLRVVGDGGTGAGTEAFIWEPTAGGMLRLFDVLIAQGATGLTGWTLQRATGISDDGNTIVGTGINPLGFTEGFVAVIPVPPAVWLFGSALGVMGWMRRNAA